MPVDVRQNPFSLYDFLGYLIPGAASLYALALVLGWFGIGPGLIKFANRYLSFDTPEVYIPALLAAYMAGHLLSYLSSVTIENFSNYAYGYPSKYLLGEEYPNYWWPADGEDRFRRAVFRVLLVVVLFPISFVDFALQQTLKARRLYARRLDRRLSLSLKEALSPVVQGFAGKKSERHQPFDSQTDFFRFLYHLALERAPGHVSKFQNYVALYGFLRTVCFIGVLTFWAAASSPIWSPDGSRGVGWTLLGTAALSFLFYMGFVKFYRRFTLEVFMAVAAVSAAPAPSKE